MVRIILRKSLLTTQQTTYRFGALGNSGLGSAEEYGFPSGKGRKKPFSAESAFIGAFGTKRHGVRVSALRPQNDRKQSLFSALGHFFVLFQVFNCCFF